MPAVLVPRVATFVVGLAAGWRLGRRSYRAMAVLAVASPCALGLAIPSAVLAAIARAGQNGVARRRAAPRGSTSRQRAGGAFDKTGTPEGRPRLVDVVPAAGGHRGRGCSPPPVAIERHSDHPLAQAVVRDARAVAPQTALGSRRR